MLDGLEVEQALDELLPERLERLRRVTGVPIALGGAIHHGAAVLDRLVGTRGDALRGLVVKSGKGLGGSVLRHRTPLRVNDYTTTVAITHDYDHAVKAEGLTSVFAVPVLIHGEVRGLLYGAVKAPSPIGDRTVRHAVVVAEQLSRDVAQRLDRPALAELAAVIRDTRDPVLRARLVRIQRQLTGSAAQLEARPVLAPREVDVLRLAEVGATNVEIAAQLGLSLETVKAYLRSAMRKLDVHNRTAAAHRARTTGLL